MSDVRAIGDGHDLRDEERILAVLRSPRGGIPLLSAAEIGAIVEGARTPRLRNAAALALVDIGASAGAERIASTLTRLDVAPQGGTLLFALEQLGGSLSLDGLVNVIRHGSFEARAEALGFVEDRRLTPADGAALERARRHLREIAEGSDAEAAEAARAAIEYLDVIPVTDRAGTP